MQRHILFRCKQNASKTETLVVGQVNRKAKRLQVGTTIDFNLPAVDPKKMAKKPPWVTQFHLNGNDVADKLADVSVNTYEVPSSIAYPILKHRKLVLAIQKRLVVILMSIRFGQR